MAGGEAEYRRYGRIGSKPESDIGTLKKIVEALSISVDNLL